MPFKFNALSGQFDLVNEKKTGGWKDDYVITRVDGKITQVAYTGADTLVYTRDSYGKVSSYTDGTNTWTLTRDANGGKITSGVVT